MRKRQTLAYALGLIMLLYGVAHGLDSVSILCGSLGCQALQRAELWWAGTVYAAVLLSVYRFRRPLLGWFILLGMVVECALVLTQVILNLYCSACLGYTALFILFVIAVGPETPPLAKKTAWAVAGIALCGAAVLIPLARTVCTCNESPFSRVSGDEQAVHLFFEPTCSHCHSVLEMLEQMDATRRVRLCPEAWSLASVWALVRDHCHTCAAWKDRVRCLFSTLTVVRANNAFCMERGLPYAPLVLHQGRIVKGSEVPGYLLSVLGDPLATSEAHPLALPGESGGSCTVNACD